MKKNCRSRVGRTDTIFRRGATNWSPRATHTSRRAVRRAFRASTHPASVSSVPRCSTPSLTVRGIRENGAAMARPEICSSKTNPPSRSRGSTAKEQRRRLGALHSNAELIKFYRERVADFERERDELIGRLDGVGIRRAELHQAEWELKKRTDEAAELQKALSDAHAYLFEERERLLKVQAENDELKLQEVEDRRRIQHLLQLMNPAEPEVAFSRESPPGGPAATASYAKNTANADIRARLIVPKPTPKESISEAALSGPAPAKNTAGAARTVFLPAQNVETLKLKVASLEGQLRDQRKFSEERVAALLEDRRIRDADETMQKEQYEKKASELRNRLARTEDLLQKATKDFILAKTAPYVVQEQQALLEQEMAKLSGERAAMQTTIAAAAHDAASVAKAKAETYVNQFKDRMQRRSAVAAQYERRIGELERENKKARRKMRELERRRAMDLEGFTADVTTLRKLLSAVDRRLHQTRLAQRLDDDERLDALLERLERRAPDPAEVARRRKPFEKGPSGYVGPTDADGLAYDLRHIRGALGSVADRLEDVKRRNVSRDDSDEDDAAFVARVDPGEPRPGAENAKPAVIVARGAAGPPRNRARKPGGRVPS